MNDEAFFKRSCRNSSHDDCINGSEHILQYAGHGVKYADFRPGGGGMQHIHLQRIDLKGE